MSELQAEDAAEPEKATSFFNIIEKVRMQIEKDQKSYPHRKRAGEKNDPFYYKIKRDTEAIS